MCQERVLKPQATHKKNKLNQPVDNNPVETNITREEQY